MNKHTPRHLKTYLLLSWIFLLITSTPALAAPAQILKSRIHDHTNYTRLVLETSDEIKPEVFTLKTPPRLVIDIKNSNWNAHETVKKSTVIKKIRRGNHEDNTLRIVLDLNKELDSLKSFSIKKNEKDNHRFVLDIKVTNNENTKKTSPIATTEKLEKSTPPPPSPTTHAPIPIKKHPPIEEQKKLVIIDAGHGGHDPGAIGYAATKEKYITLSYAKALQQALARTGRYRTKLTRNGDYYIKLHDRVKIAKSHQGDLFISLHADSHKNRKTKGLSIYTLSEKASDREAASLAKKANSEEIIHGLNFDEQYDDITDILIDLVQRNTTNESSQLAENLTAELKKEVQLLRNAHRFAGFRVLTAPDIPSVLIELGYLSNRTEEKLLNTQNYKKKLINAIVKGIDRHFSSNQVNMRQ